MAFFGRQHELKSLHEDFLKNQSSLVVIHGRRRVGKTRLLKEFSHLKPLLWFEGLEKGGPREQLLHFLVQFKDQTKIPLPAGLSLDGWRQAFDCLTDALTFQKKTIIVFDEFPWMINQDEKAVALFKYYWDNKWSQHKNLMMVLCGSINTFMVKKVVRSSALYGRIHREICLEPLSLAETKEFLGPKRPVHDVAELFMTFGGVPKYLEEIRAKESSIQNINRLCFLKDAFFVQEFDRLFKEEFKEKSLYPKIVRTLMATPGLTYSEIIAKLNLSEGGGYQIYLDNLCLAGFIQSFKPLGRTQTQLIRYRLYDEYLHFYFGLMQPHLNLINTNIGQNLFLNVLGKPRWSAWSGLSFERLCLRETMTIQKILKIDQLVKNYGSYFNRQTTGKNGLQIDLVFERHDNVINICEIKNTRRPVGTDVIQQVEKKTAIFKSKKRQVIQPILITATEPSPALVEARYFHHIILLKDFFWAANR
ncbi:MAG: AAA family ATPase [Deltaproteobacteria bacterium]|nr:AAA family ATPase [Deltaproteobacteria bacterium]